MISIASAARHAIPLLFVPLLAACAGGIPEPAGAPVADPGATAAALVRATTPVGARRITFGWTLNESGSRLAGRGVVRAEDARRLRLDLFGPRNESYLSAALVGDDYRVPAAVADRIALPSPAILWGGLGAVSPPAGAELVAATATDSSATLRYLAPDGSTYQYVTAGSGASARLESVERSGEGGRLESVRLTRDATGRIDTADYRNWSEYRELILDFEEQSDVASFPEDTWTP